MPRAADYGVEDVEELITTIFGLTGSRRGFEYDMLCPDPDHNDDHPSCSVNLDSGYWNCFSCGVGGDLVKLGSLVLGKTEGEVRELLKPNTPEAMITSIQRRLATNLARHKMKQRPRRKEPLPEYEPLDMHEELEQRLFKASTIKKWGFAWCPEQKLTGNKGEFTIKDSIAIPIRDQEGQLLCWCYRRTKTSPHWQPRYLYTPGVEVSELWFGLEHYYPTAVRQVTIVEGALDAAWNDQCGFPALGLLGSKMGDAKIMWLQSYDMIWTLPDHDNGGAQWLQRVTGMLGSRIPIRLCQYRPWMMKKTPEESGSYRPAKDPEELRQVDLEIMHQTAPLYLKALAEGKITPPDSPEQGKSRAQLS